ncbi:TetR family transcriptional regulator [Nocardia sp. CDC153]|uniref:TetR/AcrR family transcriptional regulator n=1 Tax=Nocardia sp. CDC153 TaxID=3112167 RepID=UPI002DB70731|nr:TetR family transcriptional regulator [Nocardia sp. CDC153]MEC3953252.1 TetR family transcriptional regulator [Nocardia sp. CDC153]
MATAAEQGHETRARLMAAAVELLAEHGWGGVTTRLVADRASVAPGLVHYHFTSVTDLLIDASVQAAQREYESAMAGVLALSGPDAMRGMLAAIAAYTTADPMTVAMTEMMLAATRHERLRVELGRLAADARAAMAGWFRGNGSVPDPEATAAVVAALLDGLILHRLLDPSLGAVDVTGPLLRVAG